VRRQKEDLSAFVQELAFSLMSVLGASVRRQKEDLSAFVRELAFSVPNGIFSGVLYLGMVVISVGAVSSRRCFSDPWQVRSLEVVTTGFQGG